MLIIMGPIVAAPTHTKVPISHGISDCFAFDLS
jgi:hypothetical protein